MTDRATIGNIRVSPAHSEGHPKPRQTRQRDTRRLGHPAGHPTRHPVIPPGGSVSIGFQATHTGNSSSPSGFTLDGAACG
ncbi:MULTISPECIES: cellulose binding domain-containing protein [unclassified Solwaraspora]|uniref:cellulose binding domain-containing protein n=1 Tax=unclassified Solwaraspora TaxID=2627926 RepID=UPI00248B9E91|nr:MULTISPECIES: cellulose binding domain-containing protein [unclassified Solwaraspora]WBB99228.1 cellulose binding domain-containing protein [Solwaraspora sp. WMMA2059]WJK35736.1 cellulose binding domain-containing protein [Solwaraspora sp. WMMA2065]